MKKKMYICGVLALAISPICTVLGEETSPGIVHGPKAGFNITAPEGWVLDTEAGKGQGFQCVLYPKVSSWRDAKTVMYANVAAPQWEGVNVFVAMAIKEMKAKHGIPKEKIASGKTKDGHDYFINEYPATKTYSQWERVGYVQLPQGVGYIVLTSRDQTSYKKDSGVLEKVLQSLVAVEPKSEVASGQEYAHRYRQLLDQHADGQIEPLLTEWREKAPDDPDAWITSANHYFNERQTNIATKKPGPGDITLTDKKGKTAGSISFEQTEGMKRAVDLLQEATTKFPDHLDIWCGLAFMYQESGDFDSELSTLKKMVAYAREHPAQLKWLKGEPLGEPADKFVPDKLHEYGLYYEKKENAEDDERWFQIATLATDSYPKDPQGFKDAAGYWADIGEWQKARESFEKAHQLDPKSVVALIGLGQISVEMKDFASARKYYEEALKLEPNGQYAQTAKEALQKLKKTPEGRQASQPNSKEANAYNERGVAKGVKGDIDGAIADFTRAIELYPKYGTAYNNRGLAKKNKGDLDGAIADCTRAIELDPKDAGAYGNRGIAKQAQGDLKGAIADYTRAIELDPKFAKAYTNRGIAKEAKGDVEGAIADCSRAIKLDPKYVPAYNTRGLAKKNKGDLNEAITDYTRAVELDPKYVNAYYNRGLAKGAKGDIDGAIADYTRGIELDPKNAVAYNERGIARQGQNNLNEAIADYSRAVELDPKYPNAYYNRGVAKWGKGDIDGAIADQTRAIEFNPKFTEAFYNRGLAKKQKGDLDGAIADYNRVIEINPDNPKYAVAYDDRGIAKQAKGDVDGAIADCTRAIELNPKYANAYNNRGSFKGIKGDVVGAIADINRAIELDPKLTAAYYNRAYTEQGKGDIDEAIGDYRHAIEMDPRCARCYYNRGACYFNKQQYDAAIKDLQKVVELDPKNGAPYLSLGWYQLFNRKPHESIAASLKALELSPDKAVLIKGNLAHGYLFDKQFEKAKVIYLENKDSKLPDGKAFSQAVLDDFKDFQEAGITHPDMEKIKALLTSKGQDTKSTNSPR
jgi:tetratricopeptide (TPR) repeat protein